MSNVLSNEQRQQILALGRLGWTLRRIEQATGSRRETVSAYLTAAGLTVRGPGRPATQAAKPATRLRSRLSACSEPSNNHKGDVYDPFVGSGTTVIAGEQEGRIVYAIEIEPAYVDVTVTRWEDFTGRKAKRLIR